MRLNRCKNCQKERALPVGDFCSGLCEREYDDGHNAAERAALRERRGES